MGTRWYYRQRMSGQVSREAAPWIMTLSPGCFPAADCPGSASPEIIDVPLDGLARTTVSGIKSPASDAQTIRPDAKLLLVTGAGWTKKQTDGQPHVKEAGRTHPRLPGQDQRLPWAAPNPWWIWAVKARKC